MVGLEEGAARVCRLEQKGGPAPASEKPRAREGAWARPAPHGPTGFVMLLRKHLEGRHCWRPRRWARTGSCASTGRRGPRATTRTTPTSPKDGERVRLVLWVELTPKAPLVVLTDEVGVILGSQGAGVCARPLTGGATYAPPPPRRPPRCCATPRESPLHLGGLPPDGGRSRAVAASFEALALRLEAKARGGEALRRLQRQLDTLGKRVSAVEQDAKRAEEAQGQKRKGELLQGAYGRVAKGASSVEVQDYWEEGAPLVTVALDPKLDLQGNIDRCLDSGDPEDAEGRILERLEECERRGTRRARRWWSFRRRSGRPAAGRRGAWPRARRAWSCRGRGARRPWRRRRLRGPRWRRWPTYHKAGLLLRRRSRPNGARARRRAPALPRSS